MSSLKFGTSGLRGLVTDLVGPASEAYTVAFLRHLAESGRPATALLIGRDLRSSSSQIAGDCARAARKRGVQAIDCGALPTPALAAEGLRRRLPSIMVTGSHIPEDRNGLKFYAATGEISKEDETGIQAMYLKREPTEDLGIEDRRMDSAAADALSAYRSRNVDFFGRGSLEGLSVGLYEHSTVGRDVLFEILSDLGANVTRLARAESFVALDTEAHRAEDLEMILGWTADRAFDAIVSADGDADRPLVADECGKIVRGDVLGLMTARFLRTATVATPVTSSSSIERVLHPLGTTVRRTRVGSPFVLAAMKDASDPTVGFEANGGVLLGSNVEWDGKKLLALPTRDAVLPILVALHEIRSRGEPLSRIVADLGVGFTAADRVPQVPSEASALFLGSLQTEKFRETFLQGRPDIEQLDTLDGVRFLFVDGSVVHFRASGNAPELRCYIEAGSQSEADDLLRVSLARTREALQN